MITIRRVTLLSVMLPLLIVGSTVALAQCPEEPDLQNWTGGGTTGCHCFIPGEEAGAILDLPAEDFPIEILRIGIGWGSQFGSAPDSLEQSIHIYSAGLPNPGAPIFSLDGPVLVDGVINEFDIEPLAGEVILNSGPFLVSLEFANENVGDGFAPTTVHDGNGCAAGQNAIFVDPGFWLDSCLAGVGGDWIFYVVYRPVTCGPVVTVGAVPDGDSVPGAHLTVEPFSGNLLLQWGASCTPTDNNYEIYEGTIGDYYTHESKLCSTGGAPLAIILPDPGNTYYLVVPRNDDNEGSYGFGVGSTPRPPGDSQCLPQQAGVCP